MCVCVADDSSAAATRGSNPTLTLHSPPLPSPVLVAQLSTVSSHGQNSQVTVKCIFTHVTQAYLPSPPQTPLRPSLAVHPAATVGAPSTLSLSLSLPARHARTVGSIIYGLAFMAL